MPGAMGHTQFMPSSWKEYAADFDGDGRRNVWTDIPDALASTANYLKRHGWEYGKTWGYEVVLPGGFDPGRYDRGSKLSLRQWTEIGVRRANGRAFPRPDDQAYLLMPAGARGPAFLMLKNFDVIKRYNNADSYALAVGHLGDRILGGGPIAQSWPKNERPLSRSEIEEMQSILTRRGFSTGGIDGNVGPMTRKAIREFEQAAGKVADGHASTALLDDLRRR
jgi:membrane-bound lytic murein transglycosylase B